MEQSQIDPINKEPKFYPIYISSPEYKKLLCVMTQPEYKIWYKDEEITQEQLIEILSNEHEELQKEVKELKKEIDTIHEYYKRRRS